MIMEQVVDEAGEAAGHNDQGHSEPGYWELNISLNILLTSKRNASLEWYKNGS